MSEEIILRDAYFASLHTESAWELTISAMGR